MEYVISRDVGYDGEGVYFEIYRGPQAEFTDLLLESGQAYYYKVKSLNIIGLSQESEKLRGVAG